MDKNYEKPRVIIDIDEYNNLKDQIKDIQYNTVTYLKERVTVRRVNPFDDRCDPLARFEGAYLAGNTNEQSLMEYINNVLNIVELNITTNDGKQIKLQFLPESKSITLFVKKLTRSKKKNIVKNLQSMR